MSPLKKALILYAILLVLGTAILLGMKFLLLENDVPLQQLHNPYWPFTVEITVLDR